MPDNEAAAQRNLCVLIEQTGRKAVPVRCDVSRPAAVKER